MDSITQAVLGATLAGAISGKKCTPKVLLAGAALGTLPDLDVFIDYGDPILNMVKHRGFTHSLFVLIPFALLLAGFWQRFFAPTWSFIRLSLLITSALITHPLLDSFTAYGTQLFWPLAVPPVSISSIFIIDPLYTLPLIFSVIGALVYKKQAAFLCCIGLLISSVYLCLTFFAQQSIIERISSQTAGRTTLDEGVFVAPTLFNSMLWRVVVMEDDHYKEALVSLFDENEKIDWILEEKGQWPLAQKPEKITELENFSRGFVRYKENDGVLTATDVRLGMAMSLLFQFDVAKKDQQGNWQAINPVHLLPNVPKGYHMSALWQRLLGDQSINPMLNRPTEK